MKNSIYETKPTAETETEKGLLHGCWIILIHFYLWILEASRNNIISLQTVMFENEHAWCQFETIPVENNKL